MGRINWKWIACIVGVAFMLSFSYSIAFSRSFVYDFAHYLPSRVYNGKAQKIKISFNVSHWGSKSFVVKQVSNDIFFSKTYATKTINKKAGNKQTITFSNHGSCQYQFWKKEDGKRIQGTGKINW